MSEFTSERGFYSVSGTAGLDRPAVTTREVVIYEGQLLRGRYLAMATDVTLDHELIGDVDSVRVFLFGVMRAAVTFHLPNGDTIKRIYGEGE